MSAIVTKLMVGNYSPREKHLLRTACDVNHSILNTKWVTTEDPPRSVEILGTSWMDPDVQVIHIEGEKEKRWLMACGSAYDGKIVGTEIFIREVFS